MKTKVLYLVSGINTPSGWGTEFIQNLIFKLSQKNIEATILSPIYIHTDSNISSWVKQIEKDYGVRIITIDAPKFIKKILILHLLLTPMITTISAIKLLSKEKFDLIHEFSSIPFILIRSLIFKTFFKTKTVFSLAVLNKSILGSKIWFKVFDFASLYLIPSTKLLTDLENFGINPKKLIYSPPGIDLTKFNSRLSKKDSREKLNLPLDKFIVSYYGTLTKEKGIETIIKSSKILEKEKDIIFVIFSIWRGEKNINSYKNQLKRKNILLFQRYIDITLLLNASDVVIFPQLSGYGTTIPPISVIEATVSKTPVIATDIVGNDEVLPKGSLIKANNENLLSEKILDIYNNKQVLEESKIQKFDIEKSVRLHLDLYEKIK
ncbi:glycosyltransferase [Candidatus Microgenomates bacterium]|nr:glycosyltransferase [Candidatus Microgenomates bacterium]